MPLLEQISSLFLSATNENNVGFANLKWDFSLVKVEAPVEFAPLGSALTRRRRDEAETGAQHKTARRLAALFEQIIPSTPKLVTAYGHRVSEIIQKPNVNPPGFPTHGCFQEFVGADATAVWAAATSGIPALGVYLLACLLARAWNAKESISIWVELISDRRKEIEKAFHDNEVVSESSLIGARQEISRCDLGLWDASARSWLRSADQGKQRESDQLMLILKNIEIPFTSGPSTYESVVSTWQQAMVGMENLLCGRPQSISSASILLALSSWHLYPDLIVLRHQTVNVKFSDPLFPSNAVGTIGLSYADASDDHGIRWSLTLSHLVYYGDPIVVESKNDYSRVTIKQLCLVAFGAVLRAWRINLRDLESSAKWFCGVWASLKQSKHKAHDQPLARQFAWFYVLVLAANSILGQDQSSHEQVHKLVKFGYRRAQRFLGLNNDVPQPYFGLCNPCVLAGLSEKLDIECAIGYLRAIAQSLDLDSGSAMIVCRHWVGNSLVYGEDEDFCEYITAVGHPRSSGKRGIDGRVTQEISHSRWFHTISQSKVEAVSKEINARAAYVMSRGEASHILAEYQAPGGAVKFLKSMSASELPSTLYWEGAPLLYSQRVVARPNPADYFNSKEGDTKCPSLMGTQATCQCFQPQGITAIKYSCASRGCHFTRLMGEGLANDLLGLELYVQVERDDQGSVIKHNKMAAVAALATLAPDQGLERLAYGVNKARLWDYLCYIVVDSWPVKLRPVPSKNKSTLGSYLSGVYLLSGPNKLPASCSRSLFALYSALETYRSLSGATIPLRLISGPLNEAMWIPKLKRQTTADSDPNAHSLAKIPEESEESEEPILQPPILKIKSRSEAFACIIHLDSGIVQLHPDHLNSTLAMCCENSIYVAGILLSDPIDQKSGGKIQRLIGNIGRTGISLLVAPQNPKIRPQKDDYNVVTHARYDSKRENNFGETTLHLSFTDWSLPIPIKGMRTIDQDVQIIESVISVRDRGAWVADLDVIGVDFDALTKFVPTGKCSERHEQEPEYEYTSLDSWEELLDYPESVGIFRAHGNWVARLAAVSIIHQMGQGHSVGVFDQETFCLRCLEAHYKETALDQQAPFQSYLPSFCID